MYTHTPARSGLSPVIGLLMSLFIVTLCDFIFFIETKEYRLALMGVLSCLSLLLLPVFFFRKNIKLYLALLWPVFLLLPFNLGSILLFDLPISDATLLLAMNTNVSEASELLSGYVFLIIVGLAGYLTALFVLVRYMDRRLQGTTALALSAGALITLLLLPMLETGSGSYVSRVIARYYTIYPTSLFFAAKTVYKQNQFIEATSDQRAHYTFGAQADTTLKDPQVVILILGESSRYDHWGINGYHRNTSPRLARRNDLISFRQAAAGGFITELAVPLILTGIGADNFDQHYRQKGITGAFREAGFKTYWITNQIDDGHIKLHQEDADVNITHPSSARANRNVHRDMELVEALKEVISEPASKKFIIIHTLGNHYNYSSRYPDEYDLFTPSNKTLHTRAADNSAKPLLINSYDNSILYTDAVIDSVIRLVESKNTLASVTYLSDHGENLFDDERKLSQHASPQPSRYIAHIPFFMWCSPKLVKTYPKKVNNLRRHARAKISSRNLIYTLTHLNGITYPEQDSTSDITSPYFKDDEQLILGANGALYKATELH